MTEPASVGIDFGTSYSSVSAVIGDRVCSVADVEGRALIPSVVHFPDDAEPIAGFEARALSVTRPQATVLSPKRLLGRAHAEDQTAALLHSMGIANSAAPDGSVVLHMGRHDYALVQVCVPILAKLKAMAEDVLHRPVGRAVFSVPVTFTETQKTALRRAGELAGIETLAQIDEPAAAAMAYGFGRDRNEIVAVYDFGGGTFDFTVIDISGYSFEVLARAGDSWLGGDDLDLAVASAVGNAFWRATNIELRHRVVEWRRLLHACEQAKRELTQSSTATISIPRLIEQPRVINVNQPLSREQFESLIKEHVDRSIAICRSAMAKAGLEADDIVQVVMSGGVSHIPLVRRSVEGLFGRPIETLVDPDRAIGLGTGLRAAQLSQHPVAGTGGIALPR